MTYYLVKLAVTTILIGKSPKLQNAAPSSAQSLHPSLVSVLAMIWLYIDTKDASKVSAPATSVFWLVLPLLASFIALPLLLKQGLNFYPSMSISIAVTVLCYGVMVTLLDHFGIKL